MKTFCRNSFGLFYSFTIFQLISSAPEKGADDEYAILTCEGTTTNAFAQHYSLFEDEQVCCGLEKYTLGTTSEFLKYYSDCNMEPKNETMSLEDSYWTIYYCLITKALGSNDFTEADYVALLTKNLSNSKSSAILSAVKEIKMVPIKDNGNIELQAIKAYWANYFSAEYQVCTESLQLSEPAKETTKNYWDPSNACVHGKSPRLFFLPVKHEDTLSCVKSFMDKTPTTPLNTSIPFDNIMYTSCTLILGGLITEQDLSNANLNYDALVTNGMPKFFSKALKIQVLKSLLDDSRIKYESVLPEGTSNTAGIQEISKAIMKDQEEVLGDIMNTDKKDLFLNIFTINELVADVFETVQYICSGSKDTPDSMDLSVQKKN